MYRTLGDSTAGVRVMKLPLKILSVCFPFSVGPSVLCARYSTVVSVLVSASQSRYPVTVATIVPSHLFLPSLCVPHSEHRNDNNLAIRMGLKILSVV